MDYSLTLLILAGLFTMTGSTILIMNAWKVLRNARSQSYVYYHNVIQGYVLDCRRVLNISLVDFTKIEFSRLVVTVDQLVILLEEGIIEDIDSIIVCSKPRTWLGIPTVPDLNEERTT